MALVVFDWSWPGIEVMCTLHIGLTVLRVLSIVLTFSALIGFPLAELAVFGVLLLLSVSATVAVVSASLLYWRRYRVFEIFKA